MDIRKLFTGLLLAAFCAAALPALAEENKVIVKDFRWKVLSTAHFDIHYYDGSEPWKDYAAQVLEAAYAREAADLYPAMDKRVPFFLYASVNDMEQTNVADVSDGVGGLTEPYKDRFMAWSDGSREWLRDVIEHEFAHEVEFAVLVDGFWKSARILKTYIYPLWMMEGMAEYETGMQDYAVEKMYVRDAALSGGLIPLSKLAQFGHLKPHQTTLAYKTGAQAIRFLAGQYGQEKPRRMLELFRTRYDAASVLGPLVGTDLKDFERKFAEYTELKYLAEARAERLQEPGFYGRALTAGSDTIPEFNMSPAVSPDGKSLAWLSTRDGHPAELRIRALAGGPDTVVTALAAGAENVPYGRFTKPLRSLAWSPDGRYIAFSGQRNHAEYLYLYDTGTRKVARAGVQGLAELRQPAFSPDGRRLAFVGMSGAYNDIYEAPVESLAAGGTLPAAAVRRLTSGPQDDASPAYAPDGSLAWSCETSGPAGLRRALCLAAPGAAPRELFPASGSVYDPAFSPDGAYIYFVSDAGDDFELYRYETGTGKVLRLTRSMGGSFTPLSAGGKVYFSAFRRGGMDVYEAAPENFLYEDTGSAAPAVDAGFEVKPASGSINPYKFKASTDLFFPAFLFSAPGGLFWVNYWQASDMLGNHNLGMYLNYNSGSGYMSLQTSYSYARYRMPLLLSATVLNYDGLVNSDDLEYDKRYVRGSVGTAWPFDRYNRVELYAIAKNEKNRYTDIDYTEDLRTRGLQLAYVRDTVNGLYLTAVRGSRTELSWLGAAPTAGGNQKYDVYLLQYQKYFPLSKRSALVNRFTAGRSTGRDRRTFDFGGLGGVRAFSSSSDENDKPGVIMENLELRAPLVKDMDYYMWYMFPDFYFKGLYGKVFADYAYGWDSARDLRRFGAADLKGSVGAGVDLHAFILQAFQMVLSFDYAVRTTDGGRIFYFYLGPMF